jgi:hypothetical protein
VKTAGGPDAIVGAMQHREFTTTDDTRAGAPGVALLGDPIANKGTGFSAAGRRELGLDGLLPPSVLRLPSMWRGLAMLLPFSLGFGAFMLVFALTTQDGLHYDALRGGLAILPMAALFFAGPLAPFAAVGVQLAIVVLLVLATRALPSFSTATTNQVIADA